MNGDVTAEVMIERLRDHYGEWVVRDCINKGVPGLLVQDPSGKTFIVSVVEVKGLVLT